VTAPQTQRTPAEQAAELRADLAALVSMRVEVEYEYTPKTRLRVIADALVNTLLMQYGLALASMEHDAPAADSGIIVAPEGAAPGGGLIAL
jgi:hypothetical protein